MDGQRIDAPTYICADIWGELISVNMIECATDLGT